MGRGGRRSRVPPSAPADIRGQPPFRPFPAGQPRSQAIVDGEEGLIQMIGLVLAWSSSSVLSSPSCCTRSEHCSPGA